MGEVLWDPPLDGSTAIEGFMDEFGFDSYESLRRWSITDLEAFWSAVWAYCGVQASAPYERVLSSRSMPGARWFEGARLSYAEHALRRTGPAAAIIGLSESRDRVELSWDDLRTQVAQCRSGLAGLGVQPGDRIAAYLPNVPEAVVAFLAAASLGATWTSCSPEYGVRAVVDRFGQVGPKVLFVVDGYRYGSSIIDRTAEVATLDEHLPTVEHVIRVPYLAQGGDWDGLLARGGELHFEQLPADHPLYVLYTSGTTGPPKAIVHGQGLILLEHLKVLMLHADLGTTDRFMWFTTTGWMMWNYLISGLLLGSAIVTFDGDPAAGGFDVLWQTCEDERVTWFGASAPFLMACRRSSLRPKDRHDLSALRAVGSTGAPLPAEGYRWVYDSVKSDVMLSSISGGTDVCSAFVGGCPVVPVRAGEISCRYLGAAVDELRGQLVITEPMPSMPIGFWGDDGSRYRAAYFDENPGVWTHGDWVEMTETGGVIITGRSDATLNRGGIRTGTAEIYAVVEGVEGVTDSLVVHLDDPSGGAGSLVLLVSVEDGTDPRNDIRSALRSQLSPRHVPDEIYFVSSVPTTFSGKKLELPVKQVLSGADPARVASSDSLRVPSSLEEIQKIAEQRRPIAGDASATAASDG